MTAKTFLCVLALGLAVSARGVEDAGDKAAKEHKDLVEHGSYLVHRVAMCVQCHSPRDEKGELIRGEVLKGGPMPVQSPFRYQAWAFRAPPLAGLPVGYTDQDMVNLLMKGVARSGAAPRHPMPPFRFNEYDARSVVAYLKSVSAAEGAKDTAPASQAEPPRAVAVLRAPEGSGVAGVVMFTSEGGAVHVRADVVGLTPGLHALHIHEGSCADPDGHFNPEGKKHGAPDDEQRHAGDLGNVIADETGRAHYERVDPGLRLDGENAIIGRSIAVKSKWDDLKTDPDGGAGEPLACGVIQKMQ